MKDNENIKGYCNKKLCPPAQEIINHKQAEIERLQQKNSELESDLILKTYDYEHLLMKCKELQAISSSRKDRLMQTVVKLQTAKSEARKEFAERLKKKQFTLTDRLWVIWEVIKSKDIDNL